MLGCDPLSQNFRIRISEISVASRMERYFTLQRASSPRTRRMILFFQGNDKIVSSFHSVRRQNFPPTIFIQFIDAVAGIEMLRFAYIKRISSSFSTHPVTDQ